MNDAREVIQRPEAKSSSMWVDEAIWGHRLYDEQTPWLTYLEFLNVFVAQGCKLEEPTDRQLKPTLKKRLLLRHLLFAVPLVLMEEIQQAYSNDRDRWMAWEKMMNAHRVGTETLDFTTLKSSFNYYSDFLEVLNLLRETSLEVSSNKRWSSRFLFPYSEECLFADLDSKGVSSDRRFFGRTGELLFLMLSRSSKREQIGTLIKERTLNADGIWSRLVAALQANDGGRTVEATDPPYLPYLEHPIYEQIADDFISLLGLALPGYDLVPHLVTVSGLHLLRYQLVEAFGHTTKEQPSFVCEILANKKTLVRERAFESYDRNNGASLRAVVAFLESIKASDDWQAICNGSSTRSAQVEAACTLLREKVCWPSESTDHCADTAELLFSDLRDAAVERHKGHAGNVHRVYGRAIGLISKRGTNRLRYAPSDSLLRTLVLVNCPHRTELSEFLATLSERYGIVIGGNEAEPLYRNNTAAFDKKEFGANTARLEYRLRSLGLLKRLSDGCAYVINPYSRVSHGN